MLTVEQAREALRQSGIPEELGLAQRLFPYIHLIPTRCEMKALPRGASRFGGMPDLPAAMRWPEKEGRPLAFLAQLDLSAVASIKDVGLGDRGWLAFFYDLERRPAGHDPADRDGWAVLHFDVPKSKLRRGGPAPSATPFHACSLELREAAAFPGWESAVPTQYRNPYMELLAKTTYQNCQHRLLSYESPFIPLVGDVCEVASKGVRASLPPIRRRRNGKSFRAKDRANGWTMLLQLEADVRGPGWIWDRETDVGGQLRFMIKRSDLVARRFDQVWTAYTPYLPRPEAPKSVAKAATRAARPAPAVHAAFDLARWVKQFPLSKLRGAHRVVPDGIDGPLYLATVEQLRARANWKAGDGVPVDTFVWAKGEPERHEGTKIGGLPYRKAGLVWPRSADGKPLTFIGQICVADSRDIIGKTPGDVLLIFGDLDAVYSDERGSIKTEWSRLGLRKTTTASELPKQGRLKHAFHGVIHRTNDYPLPEADGRGLRVMYGTKVGGIGDAVRWGFTVPPDWRFLASLGSVQARRGTPFPFLNVPRAVPQRADNADPLMIGDAGSFHFFLDACGKVRWELEVG